MKARRFSSIRWGLAGVAALQAAHCASISLSPRMRSVTQRFKEAEGMRPLARRVILGRSQRRRLCNSSMPSRWRGDYLALSWQRVRAHTEAFRGIERREQSGPVRPGGLLPKAPTDPDVRVKDASSSSRRGFAVPLKTHRPRGDMLGRSVLSAWFWPPNHDALPPALHGVWEVLFPYFDATMRCCDSLLSFSPNFVSFGSGTKATGTDSGLVLAIHCPAGRPPDCSAGTPAGPGRAVPPGPGRCPIDGPRPTSPDRLDRGERLIVIGFEWPIYRDCSKGIG